MSKLAPSDRRYTKFEFVKSNFMFRLTIRHPPSNELGQRTFVTKNHPIFFFLGFSINQITS